MINLLKRIVGIGWMLLAPIALCLLIKTSISEVAAKPSLDVKLQWGVFIVVFGLIGISMVIFGFFAYKGEYDRLPEQTQEP